MRMNTKGMGEGELPRKKQQTNTPLKGVMGTKKNERVKINKEDIRGFFLIIE